PQATFYRNADLEWSFLLRDAGGRLVVPAADLPVRQGRHRGYADTDPAHRDRQSRRTYERFLRRFRGRDDLRLPGRGRPAEVDPAGVHRAEGDGLVGYRASASSSPIRPTPLTRSSSPSAYESRK
ncbi:MAG: hypothetical protein M3P46_07950, partial [Actinomycetota bacterium]|nr:hypothetical protein [Actinomycetota bacterium]